MPTAQYFVDGALREIGVLATGETAPGSEGDEALAIVNDCLDALGAERLSMYSVLRTAKTLASGTASYTVGSGGDLNIVRPTWIEDATLVYDTSASTPTELPIVILTDEEYAVWPQKTLQSSQSNAIYYDHSWAAGLGLIYPLPIPDVATTQLVLYTPQQPATQFADYATTSYTFPPAVRRMLRKCLALELAPSYPGATVSPLLVQQAKEAKSQFKSSNVRPLLKRGNPALMGPNGTWNINVDRYNRSAR
jgi:hypothetical protein